MLKPRPALQRLVNQGFPPLFHYQAGEASSTTPSAHSPYNGPTRWVDDPPLPLNVDNLRLSNLSKPSQSWAAWLAAKGQNFRLHGQGQRFGPESELTSHLTKRLQDTLCAIGAQNFLTVEETTTRSRRATTLKIDAWGSIDVAIFTDTGNLASAEEDKLPSSLSGQHPYNNNKTAAQVYNYLSWMAIDLGVRHPFCLLTTGDKAALCYRDVDKVHAGEVMEMDFEQRKTCWPKRFLEEPTSSAANTPRQDRTSSKTESPEPRTPIAKTKGKLCLPTYSGPRGRTNKGGGGHGKNVMKEEVVNEDEVGPKDDSESSSSGTTTCSDGAPELEQKLYRSTIYKVCDLKGYNAQEIAQTDAVAHDKGQLIDSGRADRRWIDYAALVSAALATGGELTPQPLHFDNTKHNIRVAAYSWECEHAVFTLKRWTLRFGRPSLKFKIYAVLRQLGSGADGVVHLVSGAANDDAVVDVCVAKRYHNSETAKSHADKERDRAAAVSKGMLDESYFSVRQIGTHVAFFMPYFEPVPSNERLDMLKSQEFGDLLERIAKAGLRPCFKDNEVHWRHIGMFLDMDKNRRVTMIDLLRFEEVEVPHDNAAQSVKAEWRREVDKWQHKVHDILRARAEGNTEGMADETILASNTHLS